MTTSFSSINPVNFEMTPCRVKFGGVDLGATKGNVKVSIEEKLSALKADQLGDTIIDQKVSGFNLKVETELDEILLKANWLVVFPAHKLYTDPVTGKTGFFFDSQVGASMRSYALPLVLHPLSRPDSDLTGDILIYLATAEGKVDVVFGPTTQQSLKVTWQAYPDFTTQPPRFMLFGDPSIGFFHAAAGAATAGTGNVGNGTVGTITVFDQATKTELITLQCQAPGTGGTFSVQGSVSGPLGIAKVGQTFNSGPISFVITTGATPFVTNDSFTISATAANFI